MKKLFLLIVVVILGIVVVKNCLGPGGTPINGYESTVKGVKGNVLELTSGLKARLLGVEAGREDIEWFLRSNFSNKGVILYADSHDNHQTIESPDETVAVYAVEKGVGGYCINRQVVNEYPDCYHDAETRDSTGWRTGEPLTEKKNLALYMKPRTFRIETPEGIGTGFFINEDGLAVTNWHVLAPGDEKRSIAVLFSDNPDDSELHPEKKRHFKNVLWSDDISGLDITIMSVELENNEKVPYFKIAKSSPKTGDRVATCGNPHGLTASYTEGVVSSPPRRNPNRNGQFLQYSIATNGGNSGGPICDKYGQIVAIHELSERDAEGIHYGIDAMELRKILDEHGFKYYDK